jgi:hypothetical protein
MERDIVLMKTGALLMVRSGPVICLSMCALCFGGGAGAEVGGQFLGGEGFDEVAFL